MTMILSIGNKHGLKAERFFPWRKFSTRKSRCDSRAVTFFELLVTVTILASGMVMIYKALLLSLDYQDYLMQRLYADNLIEHKIVLIQQDFQDNGTLELTPQGEIEDVVLNNKRIAFQFSYDLKDMGDLKSIFQLDVDLSWADHGRSFRLARSAYVFRL